MATANYKTIRDRLFLSTDGKPFTTSREVADQFGKQHYNVLRDIESLLEGIEDKEFNALNFELVKYRDGKGENRPEYRLSHDGFALLAMGFTGKEALKWKIAFLEAFNAMEAELLEQEIRYARALDCVQPALRPVVEETENGASRAVIAAGLGKSVRSVTYYRRKARDLGLLTTH